MNKYVLGAVGVLSTCLNQVMGGRAQQYALYLRQSARADDHHDGVNVVDDIWRANWINLPV